MKPTFSIFVCCLCLVLTSSLIAQIGPPPESEESPRQSRLESKSATLPQNLFQLPETTGSRRTFGHFAEAPNLYHGNDMFDLLRYKPVIRELGLLKYQSGDLAQIRMNLLKRRQEIVRHHKYDLETQLAKETGEFIRDELSRQEKNYESEIGDLLLPQQIERLEQIALELRIQSSGIVEILSDPQMVKQLEISSDQLQELHRLAVQKSREFDARILELKREIRSDLLSVLHNEQRSSLNKMLGERFEWNSTDVEADDQ